MGKYRAKDETDEEKTGRRKEVKSEMERWKRDRVRAKKQKKEGDAEIISLPLIRLILKSLIASPLQVSLTPPLAGIIVQAVFEIHQRNGDLL